MSSMNGQTANVLEFAKATVCVENLRLICTKCPKDSIRSQTPQSPVANGSASVYAITRRQSSDRAVFYGAILGINNPVYLFIFYLSHS